MLKISHIITWAILAGCSKEKHTVSQPPPSQATRVINVSTTAQLNAALLDAKAGDEIVMADGVYNGKFVIGSSVPGTAAKPIILRGSRNAVLDAGNINTGYVLHLQADYWKLVGFTITNGLKGLMMDGADYNIIDGIKVVNIGEEAVHLRTYSSHNIIRNSEITVTGLKTPDYGEGIYIGSAKNNWATYTNGNADRCDSNSVISNTIGPAVAAECIDIKEGTTGGFISGNTFDATGISGANGADSWMDVKGNYYQVENNNGTNPGGSIFIDGYQVHVALAGWGNYNEFRSNTGAVNASGYGVNVQLSGSNGTSTGNKVYNSNNLTGAAGGISNIPLSN